ncbi:aminotransferase class V-fold PLP-dependent enzyme [Rathayibacter sp. VKM Ac-2754]|uniref:aminotransferase class V-fold PLP-dependent enzyme n=1 Tax=Rathayibacter sp. VKM Ac-2754 TaxID=2609251 RepID=UPI0013577291|nr:aminotransferase class V-fold PLP-dependent enzyme [Rathayibacter sp. VKM Ac-2754]MWV60756.1 aminotransferase class V-fold PLP-dependent enzyme [Rathayibacter sp. VKM Ac-2754]
MIYLDSAATSYPKSPSIAEAMERFLESGTSPGRAGHRLASWAEEQVWATRTSLANLVGCRQPDRVTFSLNATMSLNSVANHLGLIGGRVLTSAFEHNSVTRPLAALEAAGRITHEVIPSSSDGPVDLDLFERALRRGDTAGVLMTWASNVSGEVLPVTEISALCREYGVFLALDAAQAFGHLPIDAAVADVVVFAGHKGLGGPQGVGGAVIGEGVSLPPLVRGGSGGRSENPEHPSWLPWSQEAGTLNGVGIAGLGAALAELDQAEIEHRSVHHGALREYFAQKLRDSEGVRPVEVGRRSPTVGVVSFTIDGMKPSSAAAVLEERFDILVRSGLHCAPLAHRTIGSSAGGTVRVSLGSRTTRSELDATIAAIRELSASVAGRMS